MRYSHRILLVVLSFIYLYVIGSIILPSQVKSDESKELTFMSKISGIVNDVVVYENVLYVAGWETIRGFDISDKSNPVQITQYYEKDCNFLSLSNEGMKLYASQGYYKCGYHLKIFDISNKAEINSINDGVSISNTGSPKEMVVQNSIAYIAYAQGGLSIVDASDGSNPHVYPLFKALPTITSDDIFVIQDVVYMPNTTGGFVAISVSDPEHPSLLFSHDLPTGSLAQYNSTGIVANDNFVVLAAGAKGIKLFDISDSQDIKNTTVPSGGYVRDIDGTLDKLFIAADSVSSTVGGIYSYSLDENINALLNDSFHHEAVDKFTKVIYDDLYIYGIDVNEGVFILDSGFDDEEASESRAFLDLPWDYVGQGMTFTEAALSMSSYFDHEYPFLSMQSILNLDKLDLVNFEGKKSSTNKYSSHDGYDWGRNAGTKYGVPQVAAADGIAHYVDTCTPCGNAIFINHGNGFQTRYYHLQDNGLITSDPLVSIPVVRGQQIGLTGFTGNTRPSDERGAHIHFMVVEDKDNDGEFSDNIPDGLVDPFGWQSDEVDPWEALTFEINDIQKTGNKSDYLWIHKLHEDSKNVSDIGGEFSLNRYKVSIPETAYSGELTLNLASSPVVILSESKSSISPSIVVVAHDRIGNKITQFEDDIVIYFDFFDMDLSQYDLSTLQIYSSSNGVDWIPEETTVDLDNKVASVKVSHLTEFALFADLIDTEPPTTSVTIIGEQTDNTYIDEVTIVLESSDLESSIAYTTYSIDGSEWNVYDSPIVIKEEGDHTVEYYSEDTFGNAEESQTTTISIRQASPELHYSYNFDTLNIDLNSTNNSASIETAHFSKNRFESVITYDEDITTVKGKINKGLVDYITIDSIKYNDIEYEIKQNKLIIIDSFLLVNQTFKYDGLVIDLLTSRLRNKTAFTMINGRTRERFMIDGLIPLSIQTNQGVLEYSYE